MAIADAWSPPDAPGELVAHRRHVRGDRAGSRPHGAGGGDAAGPAPAAAARGRAASTSSRPSPIRRSRGTTRFPAVRSRRSIPASARSWPRSPPPGGTGSPSCAAAPLPDERGRPLRRRAAGARPDRRRRGRPLALVDLGTGAGLGLHLDRYHYSLPRSRRVGARGRRPGRAGAALLRRARGRAAAAAVGSRAHPTGSGSTSSRSTSPIPATLSWLTACVPPEAGAVTRFAAASALARAHPARAVRGEHARRAACRRRRSSP